MMISLPGANAIPDKRIKEPTTIIKAPGEAKKLTTKY
jgi:hypothetical protein